MCRPPPVHLGNSAGAVGACPSICPTPTNVVQLWPPQTKKGFQRNISAALQDIGVECKVIIGRMRRAQAQGVETAGFDLMLHEPSAEDALRMQALGLGTGRRFGCGIFVPHKSAAAVAAWEARHGSAQERSHKPEELP